MMLKYLAMLAEEIGRRGHLVYQKDTPVSIRAADLKLPMNGTPLAEEELYTVSHIGFRDASYGARQHKDSDGQVYGIRLDAVDIVIPFSTLEDAHDHHHLSYCAERGIFPSPRSFLGFLNREEVEKILGASRLSPFPSA